MPKPRISAGGSLGLFRRLRSRNEFSKKSLQAAASDMQHPIPERFFDDHSVEELGRWSSMQLDQAGRLAYPVIWNEGESHFRRVEWDAALDRLATELAATSPEQAFFYSSGRSSNEAAFLLQMLARSYGSRNIHNCTSYCHSASRIALDRMVGNPAASVTLDDLGRADLAIVAGANPAANHPRLVSGLVDLRRRGGKVIVINPVRELGLVRFRVPSRPGSLLFGSGVADLYLQPHVGTDLPLFRLLLRGVIERDAVDRVYLQDNAEGFEAVEADARAADTAGLLERCGLSKDDVETAVELIARSRRGMALWSMGLTHHRHGVDNLLALGNLAAARGWIGRPGGGLMPITGHSNVQGINSIGHSPTVQQAFADEMARTYGVPAEGAGLDTHQSLMAASAGRIGAAVMLGGNLYGSSPDSGWAGEALRKVGMTAYLSTKLNTGHVHGRGRATLVLPVLARDEERQPTTRESGLSDVRRCDGGQASPDGELKSEVEVVCALAARLLPPGPFPFETMNDHRTIRDAIARVVPGYAAIGKLDEGGGEFRVARRTFREPRFDTPSGRLRLHVPATTDLAIADGQFRLTTLRSENQFNTVVYEEDDPCRGNVRRDVVMMSADDGTLLGLGEFDPVAVETSVGRMEVVVSFIDISPGNLAMYYPEANRIVPATVDEASGTPAFRSIAARIVK